MTTKPIRRTAALFLATASAAALTGCAGSLGAKMTYDDVEKAKISEVRLDGDAGDVVVRTGTAAETSIKRIVHGSTNPPSYRVAGSVLILDSACERNCRVTYEIDAPAGVAVTGELKAGDIQLTGVGRTDLRLTSGDVSVKEATGPVTLRATSGDLRVAGAGGAVTAETTSGDLTVVDAAGPVDLAVTSGDISARLTTAASVKAHSRSGDVQVIVPAGSYRVSASSATGDAAVVGGITNNRDAKNVIDVRAGSGDASISAVS